MAHFFKEPYSGKNPVPQIATKLTALVNPERANEAKAAQLQDQSGKADQKQTEKRASRLAKGYAMHVVDPVTGEELDIKNADEEFDTRNKGENVLGTEYPDPGTFFNVSYYKTSERTNFRLEQVQRTRHVGVDPSDTICVRSIYCYLHFDASSLKLPNHDVAISSSANLFRLQSAVQN